MNLVLTGYRATGKTTIGKALAYTLQKEFIDTDDSIEQREKRRIREIFEQNGWKYFRKVEKLVVKKLSRLDDKIIAVGGGAFMYKQNLVLCENARVILLIASIDEISKRMQEDSSRPPLTDAQSSSEEIREVWNRRKSRYYEVADIVINTTDGNTERIVDEIIEKLGIKVNNFN